MITLKKDSSWYRHCKARRKAGDSMCDNCPFKEYIEEWEKGESLIEKKKGTI